MASSCKQIVSRLRPTASAFLRNGSTRHYLLSQNFGFKSLLSDISDSERKGIKDQALHGSNSNAISLLKTTPFFIKRHGFARVASPPPHLQRQMGMKLYQGSAGVLIDPYHVRTKLPFVQRWFTKKGWQEIRASMLHELKTAYAVAKLRQKGGYTKKKFYSEACGFYKEINSAIANGDRNALKPLVTENMFSILKNEMKQREGVWARVHWETVGQIKIRTLQGRMASIDAKNLDDAFIQLTLSIQSNQKFGAYDRQGNLVSGDPSKQLLVEDVWVFETRLPEKKWRLCARISM